MFSCIDKENALNFHYLELHNCYKPNLYIHFTTNVHNFIPPQVEKHDKDLFYLCCYNNMSNNIRLPQTVCYNKELQRIKLQSPNIFLHVKHYALFWR